MMTIVSPTTETTEATEATETTETPGARRHRHPGATRRLVAAELRLLARDPLTLTFVLVFPVVSMLVIAGSFGTDAGDGFPVDPTQWYVASYVTVVIGATGLIMMPVHLASYREHGVLRRFAAAGFPRWSFVLAETVLGLTAVLLGGIAVLAVAAPVYRVPHVEDPVRVVLAAVAGAFAFVSLGVLLGTLLPSARAAQAVGLVTFFPSFLLGVGGPPPGVLSPALRHVADVLPLTLVTDAIRDPWLGLGHDDLRLLVVVALGVVAATLAARRTVL